ncbi:MAG TPA: HAMP domain-containing sensor histidine kinase [Solirubrobacteraceae bacterium]|nr:HAMP domain-containing sensor histidine kinase [Solirubrobacteraceae bacterium]
MERAKSTGARQPRRSARRRASPATPGGGGRFAAYVAHELRGPIALQRALVEVTIADPGADNAALRKMGERVVASCIRQQRLIDALLELVDSGRGLTRQEPVDIAGVAAGALRAHDLSKLGSAVSLAPARTTGDPDLLGRLAANLVSNAIRHNVVGGRIEVATRAEPPCAVLCVANTGPLIPTGELDRLFQPFQRLASHPPEAVQGVGLGLAVVQAVADAHNALVTARSRSAGGLEIRVSFPAIEEPSF